MAFSFKSIGSAIAKKASMAAFKMKVHSPAILVGAGIVGLVTAGVLACKATPKAMKVTERCKTELEGVKSALTEEKIVEETGKTYTEADAKKDTRLIYFQTAGRYLKTYALPCILATASIASILGGFNILNHRYTFTAGLLTAAEKKLEDYRGRVRGEIGAEREELLFKNAKKELVTQRTVDEKTGEVTEKTTEELVANAKSDVDDPFCFIFDACNAPYTWHRNPGFNKTYLEKAESELNNRLQSRGYLTLNQALEAVGMQPVDYGMCAGWLASDAGAFVSFGITLCGEITDNVVGDSGCYTGGYPDYMLHFNCRGNIMKDMPKKGDHKNFGPKIISRYRKA